MLNQAVLALKGEETEEESYATSVECDIDAYIPAAYIKMSIRNWIFIRGSLPLRQKMNTWICRMSCWTALGIYQKCGNLLVIARVRALAHKCYVTEVLVKEKK